MMLTTGTGTQGNAVYEVHFAVVSGKPQVISQVLFVLEVRIPGCTIA